MKSVKNVDEFVRTVIRDQDVENAVGLQRMVREHLDDKVRNPLPRDIEEKIRKRCEKYGLYDRLEVLTAIVSSKVAAAELCKKANRQGKAQEAQMVYLTRHGVGIDSLPTRGLGAVRLVNGELVYGEVENRFSRENIVTKSVDAERGNDLIFLKWTDGYGGAQDNQANDACNFLREASKYINMHTNSKVRFVIILDGSYYKKNWASLEKWSSKKLLVETSDSYIAKVKSEQSRCRSSKRVTSTKYETIE